MAGKHLAGCRRNPPLDVALVRQAVRDADMLRGEDPWLRRDIAAALLRADRRGPETLALLLAEFDQRREDIGWVVEALTRIGWPATPALLGLIETIGTHRAAAASR
jgi:hypothetical protein